MNFYRNVLGLYGRPRYTFFAQEVSFYMYHHFQSCTPLVERRPTIELKGQRGQRFRSFRHGSIPVKIFDYGMSNVEA